MRIQVAIDDLSDVMLRNVKQIIAGRAFACWIAGHAERLAH